MLHYLVNIIQDFHLMESIYFLAGKCKVKLVMFIG